MTNQDLQASQRKHFGQRLEEIVRGIRLTKEEMGIVNEHINSYMMFSCSITAAMMWDGLIAYLEMAIESKSLNDWQTLEDLNKPRWRLSEKEKQMRTNAYRTLRERFYEDLDENCCEDFEVRELERAIEFHNALKRKRILKQYLRTLEADYGPILGKVRLAA